MWSSSKRFSKSFQWQMVTLGDHTIAVAEDKGALVGGQSNIAWFHSTARAPGRLQCCGCSYRLGFWSHHHQPVPFQTRVRPGLLASQKPICRYTPQSWCPRHSALELLGFWLWQNPTYLPGKSVTAVPELIAGQGNWTSRLREESCSSPFCQGKGAAGEKLVGTWS